MARRAPGAASLPRAFGTLLQVGAGLGYLVGCDALRSTQPILNSTYLGALMLGVSGVFSGYWLYPQPRRGSAQYEAGLDAGFTFWGVAWWLFGGAERDQPVLRRVGARRAAGLRRASLPRCSRGWASNRQWPLPRWIALYPAGSRRRCSHSLHAQPLGHPFAQWGAVGWLAAVRRALRVAAHRGAASDRAGVEWLHARRAAGRWRCCSRGSRAGRSPSARRACGRSLPWGVVPALLRRVARPAQLRPQWPVAQHASRLSHARRCAARRRAVRLDRGHQSEQHRRCGVAAVPAAAQSARRQRRARACGARDVVELARAERSARRCGSSMSAH